MKKIISRLFMLGVAPLAIAAMLFAGPAFSQNTPNYGEQGGARIVIGGSIDVISGGDLDIESGGALKIGGTTVTSTAAELNALDGVLATVAELNRAADASTRIVNVTTATLAITELLHDGKVLTANKADGITFTLPAASGSGAKFVIVVGTTITSVGLIVQVVTDDVMTGLAHFGVTTDTTAVMFSTAADSDTVTMNGTTTGGLKGNMLEFIDIGADLWSVRIQGIITTTETTPFSAAVS